ncbi:MAG: TFIIB-type zinc ribbon-containing protein [Clostridiaceae bacterium]|nr:TFIIB-type zinc ribbon-containing protein [Clostridiaceae bacterium]
MSVITYKCPNCGGGLEFDPSGQNYKCSYCLSEFTQETLYEAEKVKSREQNAAETDSGDDVRSQPVLYTCPSCGAEIVADETTTASFCYYCHNPVVLAGKMTGGYHPDFVIPFAIDREKAVEIFTQWIGKKKYVPKAFYSPDQIEKISGVYFPYWLYSCSVDGKLDAEGTKIKTWVMGNIRYTETQKFKVDRSGRMRVEHVTRNALKKANRQLVEGVLPFEMKELREFTTGYLSGFIAENRDMNSQEFAADVAAEVRQYAQNSIKNQVQGYDSLNVKACRIDMDDELWKYALMPVWTLTYRDQIKNKIYYFACNGQTGKICGELPVDKGKLAVLFAKVFFPVLAVLLAAGYFI